MRAPSETVRQAYAAWQAGEWERFFELFDTAVVFDVSAFPEGAVYQGHDGMREAWRRWRGTWDRYEVEIEELRELGEQVLALTRVETVSKGHGVETAAEGADLWTVHDGLVVRLEVYRDRAEVPFA